MEGGLKKGPFSIKTKIKKSDSGVLYQNKLGHLEKKWYLETLKLNIPFYEVLAG